MRSASLWIVAVWLAAGVAGGASAQVPLEPGAPVPSRWAADLDRLDEDVRLRLLTPNDPRANWIRAALDKTDPASQVSHFAAARTNAPQDKLYLASLAAACIQPVQPALLECAAVDRLADWARRDEDNGVPDIVLADRARRRGESDQMLAHLEQAAGKTRFDEYWGPGVLAFWDYFKSQPLPYDPAARAVAAVSYASDQPLVWPTALQAVCVLPRQPGTDAVRDACGRVGHALALHSLTWSGRLIGMALEARSAPEGPGSKAAADARAAQNRLRARCDDERRARFDGLEAADPAVRARSLAAADAWVRAQAEVGEVAACQRMTPVARR